MKKTTLWSACFGNLFEHYDTALFGFLSPFLAPLIFPGHEPVTALILTYAMIPLGMLARPLGSLVFGYIGDVYGRKRALFLTLAGMSLVSAGIAFSPTYAQGGVLSPLIFCIGRFLQNFLAAGETMGGAIFLLENTSEKKHDLLSGLYSASTIGGILLASAGVTLLGSMDGGWRLLYLIGCLTALFGCLIRTQIDDQPTTKNFVNPLKVFWTCRKSLILIILGAGLGYANYSIALVLMNGFIPLISSITKAQVMSVNTSLLILDFCALPFFGWLASKTSREKVMLSASLAITLTAIPLFMLLKDATLATVIGVRICFVLFGVAFFAPFHAWAQKLVPAAHRYAVISFGYAIGSQLLGGPTAALSLWLFKNTQMVAGAAWFWVALACANSLVISKALMPKTAHE